VFDVLPSAADKFPRKDIFGFWINSVFLVEFWFGNISAYVELPTWNIERWRIWRGKMISVLCSGNGNNDYRLRKFQRGGS